MNFDIVIYDRVGMPFTGKSLTTEGLGGSEQHAIFLAEAFAKAGFDEEEPGNRAKTVLVACNTRKTVQHEGVLYAPSESVHAVEADTLIVWRSSPVPPIVYRKLVVMATDTYGPAYEHFATFFDGTHDATLVCVSDWQAKGFPESWRKRVIPPIIPNEVYDLALEAKPAPKNGIRKYVYASAAVKGLKETLAIWKELDLPRAELVVTNPGYDAQDVPKELPENVRFLGVLKSYWDVVHELHEAEALFYVNTFPETYGVTPALAEVLGCRIHIQLSGDAEKAGGAGLAESLDAESLGLGGGGWFGGNVANAHCHRTKPHAVAKDLRPAVIVAQWDKLLSERKSTGICLTMIVKNEAHVIERCLESVKPFVDAWIIVDTGSTDDTMGVIERCMAGIPGICMQAPWVNFAANRNQAIDEAIRHYPDVPFQLVIDADDRLALERPFMGLPLSEETDVYDLAIVDIHGDSATLYVRPHIFRGDAGYRYEGAIHEYLTRRMAPKDSVPRQTRLLEGVNYLRIGGGDRSKDAARFERDAAILEAELAKNPDDTRSSFYLAQSYRDGGQKKKALAQYAIRATQGGWEQEVFLARLYVARLREELEHPVDAVVAAYTSAMAKGQILGRAEAHYFAARYERVGRGLFLRAYDVAKAGLAIPRPAQGLFLDDAVYEWMLLDELAISAFYIDKLDEARALNQRLLDLVPARQRSRVETNLRFCKESLER